MEKIEALKQERHNILLQIHQEKANNNNIEILKSLKNKYHSISNKINYQQNQTEIRERKKILNKQYETPETNEKKRNYARQYQQIMREIIKSHNIQIKPINIH